MKKILLMGGVMLLSFAQAQVFQEDWDGNGPGIMSWTVIDQDGLTAAEQVENIVGWVTLDRGGEAPNYGGPDGNFAAVSTSFYTPAGTSNDWLISPVISIPEEGEYFVKWDAKAQDPNYPDGYNLMLSPTAGNTIDDFTVTLFSTTGENSEWITRIASLGEYSSQDVTLAWVNNSSDMFVLLVDNISVQLIDGEMADCPTLLSPMDQEVDVDNTEAVMLSWEPAETGGTADSYTVYVGTSIMEMNNLGNTTETSMAVTGFAAGTTYYWSVVANNLMGSSEDCETFSFTTMPSEFEPYCGPLDFPFVEAITYVGFAGIDNTTSAESEVSHENFIEMMGEVEQGETYEITLKGNTSGNYTNTFVVFIDWNQDGEFSATETYQIAQTIVNSTGTDGIQAVQDIMVPADAMEGVTRMRVKKIFGSSNLLNGCMGASFGQAEDYSLNVSTGGMGTSDFATRKIGVYPNPATSTLNISGVDAKNVKVFNTLGQQMKVYSINNTVNVESLAPGAYVLQVVDAEGNIKTTKFIKK